MLVIAAKLADYAKMDNIDKKIIKQLQIDGRLTNQELAERVNLSPSPCLRRVRQLEAKGIIQHYSAVIDPVKVGLPITAFVEVRLEKQNDAAIQQFEQGIKQIDQVLACYLMAGARDYLLHVVAQSLKDYEQLVREKLTKIPGIGELETHFAFGTVKQYPVLPIP